MLQDEKNISLPRSMKAMVLEAAGQSLKMHTLPVPSPGPGQLLARVIACGVCRTDLHIADGELMHPKLPLIPGHETVAVVAGLGTGARKFRVGDIIGIPWLAYTCGDCSYCLGGKENLCDKALFNGYTVNGGFAEFTVSDERFCFPLPATYANASGAPLMCAGLIGYRAYRMAGDNISRLGLYGFGAAAHIIAQVAIKHKQKVFAFTREGDRPAQDFALQLGAAWSGDTNDVPPEKLDAAIVFAPSGELVPLALKAVDKGGRVICAGIHMSDIPSFAYDLLWEERCICSVANLTREDAFAFFQEISRLNLHPSITLFPLENANEALQQLRDGKIHGAAVLLP